MQGLIDRLEVVREYVTVNVSCVDDKEHFWSRLHKVCRDNIRVRSCTRLYKEIRILYLVTLVDIYMYIA